MQDLISKTGGRGCSCRHTSEKLSQTIIRLSASWKARLSCVKLKLYLPLSFNSHNSLSPFAVCGGAPVAKATPDAEDQRQVRKA